MHSEQQSPEPRPWHTLEIPAAVSELNSDTTNGLSATEAGQRLDQFGPNSIPTEPAPNVWKVAVRILIRDDPMNLLLIAAALIALYEGQIDTGVIITLLIGVNVTLGTRQEMAAKATVQALQTQQIPMSLVLRDGTRVQIESTALVPGDVLILEAGDIVPADCRIIESASLETSESALTGESLPVSKDGNKTLGVDTALGDRTNLLFQSTLITRGTATGLVTTTGLNTEVGKIARMLSSVETAASPLQREIKRMTKHFSILAGASAVFVIAIGFMRDLDLDTTLKVAIATVLAAIPAGLPTFITAMLAFGAKRLAVAKAIVRDLVDVEALGSITAVNSDKTGTLTLDRMTATSMFHAGQWFTIEGTGYAKTGAILHAAGKVEPDFTTLGYDLTLCSDAIVSDTGEVVGDPTEAALVVLAAKMGIDAEISRKEYPRLATVPFDSAYKFMATYHLAPLAPGKPDRLLAVVKGAPDVIMDRCASAEWNGEIVPIDRVREQLDQANHDMSAQGLRVMSSAYRDWSPEEQGKYVADPMSGIGDLTFVALIGIIDPLRPSAKEAVEIAHEAGIVVRMITGDHAVTARAIGEDLGLGPGAITGPEFQKLTDDDLSERLPELHVFGRVAPEDKLRLVSVMQERGEVVAMTGDAVNDAAAVKKADVGVAMGSGAEVSKQAAKMVLTDDNFATLVHAIELGRDIYGKITGQIRYVVSNLFAVLSLFIIANLFGINDGNVMYPVQLLFVIFFIGMFPAVGISTDTTESGIMQLPPRDPNSTILNKTTLLRWLVFGVIQAVIGISPYIFASDLPVSTQQTLTFAIMSVSTIFMAISLRRDLTPGWFGPYFPFLVWMLVPATVTWLAVDWPLLQQLTHTTGLTGEQWGAVIGVSILPAIVVEFEKTHRGALLRMSRLKK